MSLPSDHQQFPSASPSDAAVTISSQFLIAAVIFLFMVVVFIFLVYLYAKYYMASNPSRRRSRARFIFASDGIPVPRRGLDGEILKALPITIYKRSEFKEGLECSVCLSELSEGEEARLLPKCNHGFHVECIDMWFHSHATCPLCRAPVTMLESEPLEIQPSSDGVLLNFPTNVLFWGNQDAVSNGVASQEGTSSSSLSLKKPEGMLVIDIPRRAMEDIVSPLATSRFTNEKMKPPMEEVKTSKSARLRSFRRLLSRGKMVIGSSCSPRAGDIEQGEGSCLTPKTPTSK